MPNPKDDSHIDNLIRELEKKRDSKVIVYITGDRHVKSGNQTLPVLFANVANDIVPIFDDITRNLPKTKKITLVIYTNGGEIEAPWPLVNILRQNCNELEVIVMKKALSAGTLISLGADKIIMPKASFISPVDPARQIQKEDGRLKKIEIEDIIGYINFAKEKVGINNQETLGEILKELSKEIEPSLIGSINRTHSLIRVLAKKLLDSHKKKLPKHQVNSIIENLAEKLYSHSYLIASDEAQNIGLGDLIEIPDKKTEKNINDIYEYYSGYMKLKEPMLVDDIAPSVTDDTPYEEECCIAVIHSLDTKYSVKPKLAITPQNNPNQTQGPSVNLNISGIEWLKEN
jgi:hypothetical protein